MDQLLAWVERGPDEGDQYREVQVRQYASRTDEDRPMSVVRAYRYREGSRRGEYVASAVGVDRDDAATKVVALLAAPSRDPEDDACP
jgi:hypothetical protein